MKKLFKTYLLPEKLKPLLRKVWGIPIFGKKKEVEEKVKEILKKKRIKKVITVGDYCSLNLPSDVKIFDGKARRRKIKNDLSFFKKVKNERGTIQKEVWSSLSEVIKKNKNLFIEGEEDLLVIPAILLSPPKTAVIYGYPNKGVCFIVVTKEIKNKVRELLKKFQKV